MVCCLHNANKCIWKCGLQNSDHFVQVLIYHNAVEVAVLHVGATLIYMERWVYAILFNTLKPEKIANWLYPNQSNDWCKTAVTPLLTHWSYCSIALSHRNTDQVILLIYICNTGFQGVDIPIMSLSFHHRSQPHKVKETRVLVWVSKTRTASSF